MIRSSRSRTFPNNDLIVSGAPTTKVIVYIVRLPPTFECTRWDPSCFNQSAINPLPLVSAAFFHPSLAASCQIGRKASIQTKVASIYSLGQSSLRNSARRFVNCEAYCCTRPDHWTESVVSVLRLNLAAPIDVAHNSLVRAG